WLAGLIVKGFGFGLVGNIVVGIVGALIAGWIFPRLGFAVGGGILAAIIHATIGAVVLLVLIKLVKQA
ncbi:MAG: GlsB/YeaQ/YmgE family stress response membrane protein, partial [Mesorhizobium sp.]